MAHVVQHPLLLSPLNFVLLHVESWLLSLKSFEHLIILLSNPLKLPLPETSIQSVLLNCRRSRASEPSVIWIVDWLRVYNDVCHLLKKNLILLFDSLVALSCLSLHL